MDKARAWTDKELKHMEKRIRNIYVKSYNDIADKWLAYMERSAKRINTLQDNYDKAVKAGDIDKIAKTKEALYDAKMSQTFRSQYYKDMIDVTAQNITNVNQTATAYINGQLPKVASVNYNQLMTEADKVGVAFNLVDEHTVMKMIQDNDIKLPYKQLDPTKDIPWNTKKLNSAVLQGIVQGESMDKIAKRLMPIVGQNSNASIRTARTCVTGAENAGRQASYKELESKGTVIMKVWIATGDERTRESHLEIDGEEVPIDEPFSNDLMYPADPDGDPEEVYNCRCTMRSHIIGFRDAKTGEIVSIAYKDRGTMHERQIQEEKQRRIDKENAEKRSAVPKVNSSETFESKIKAIQDRIAINGIAEADILEAGKIVADEMKQFIEKKALEIKQLDTDYEILKNQVHQAYDDYCKIRDVNGEKIFDIRTNVSIPDSEKAKMVEKLNKEVDAKYDKWVELNRKLRTINNKKKTILSEGVPEQTAKLLSKIRPMGTKTIDPARIKAHLCNSRSPVRKTVEQAYSYYPTSWVEKSMARGQLRPLKVGRGYYADWSGEIAISGATEDVQLSCAFHELGHRFEHSIDDILQSEADFYARRTQGEALEWLGAPYDFSEKTRKDDFLSPYMGKDYGGRAYELNSMGMQYAYTNPMKLAEDPDMQAWVYGMLAIIP